MNNEEQEKYKVYPKLQVYNVFNIAAQTNLKETRPEMYEKLMAEASGQARQRKRNKKQQMESDIQTSTRSASFEPLGASGGGKALE